MVQIKVKVDDSFTKNSFFLKATPSRRSESKEIKIKYPVVKCTCMSDLKSFEVSITHTPMKVTLMIK